MQAFLTCVEMIFNIFTHNLFFKFLTGQTLPNNNTKKFRIIRSSLVPFETRFEESRKSIQRRTTKMDKPIANLEYQGRLKAVDLKTVVTGWLRMIRYKFSESQKIYTYRWKSIIETYPNYFT